jgi:hypothetical protein
LRGLGVAVPSACRPAAPGEQRDDSRPLRCWLAYAGGVGSNGSQVPVYGPWLTSGANARDCRTSVRA